MSIVTFSNLYNIFKVGTSPLA